ncbi:MAG: tetratricopeptide repeat protein [SAR202 cluster bacterium]|nr:tetratricopeptide repeat protein [SAR202 cluster bacterium]
MRQAAITKKNGYSVIALLFVALLAAAVTLVIRQAIAPDASPANTAPSGLGGAASTDRLIQTLQDRLSSGAESPQAYASLGGAYLQKARDTSNPSYYSMAQRAFEKSLALDSRHADALIGLGALALSRHQFQEALDYGRQAASINPYSSAAQGVIGDAYLELGQYSQAWETFQRMVDLRPDLSSYSRVSYARELQGDMPGAIQAMRQAVEAGGRASEGTSWTLVQLGHLYFKTGDLAAAQLEYLKALDLYADYIPAEAALARIYAASGDFPKAIAAHEKVVERYPAPEYAILLTETHIAAGNLEEASRAVELVNLQTRLYQQSGVNTDLEMVLFDADLGNNPSSALDRATLEYQRRPSVHAADALAWAFFKNGRSQEALGYSREALKLGTKDALMLFHAGAISHSLGLEQEARTLLTEALDINPFFSLIHKSRAEEILREISANGAPKP